MEIERVFNQWHKIKRMDLDPFSPIVIFWEVDGTSGDTTCEVWRGLSEIAGLARAGYTIKNIARGE